MNQTTNPILPPITVECSYPTLFEAYPLGDKSKINCLKTFTIKYNHEKKKQLLGNYVRACVNNCKRRRKVFCIGGDDGDIRQIPTSPLSPLRDRPLPPAARQTKSLPGTPLNNSYQTSILSPISPTISEVNEEYNKYSYETTDSECEELDYNAITKTIKNYENEVSAMQKKQKEHKQEISNLNQKILRQEEELAQLQNEGEIKDNKLQAITQKLHQSDQVNKTLKVENDQVHLELKLTNSDYLQKEKEENSEMAVKQQKLFNQISRLNQDKNLCETKKAELEQAIISKEKEYRERQTVDYGMLARAKTIYLDHSRSDSMSSLSTRVQSPTLDFELTLKTPQTVKSLGEELNDAILNESEKSLDTTLNNLIGEIEAGISLQAVQELEDRILALTQQQEADQQRIRQQEANYELKEAQNREKKAEAKIKELETKLLQKSQELSLKSESWQDELEIVTNERNSHRQTLQLLAAEKDATAKREQELLREVEELKKQNQSLEESMDLTEALKEMDELNELTNQIEQKELNKQNIALLTTNIKKQKTLILDLKKQLEEASKELDAMEKERDELSTKNTQLQTDLDNEKKNREERNDEIADLIAESNKELKTELDEFKQKEANQAKKNDQALTEAEKEAQELLAQIEDLGRAMNIN
ncbi:21088_t:CDS:2 [Gigaspora margarita]|uniref:21088_t:CDS:1 n=1 Tax=Gigaspora margarita TaxID=4874 RepID=A0ABN7VS03_GIGMA|nr:21088_t:CDS:2 [Gigaspora margarita]